MSNATQVYARARELVEQGWTQGVMAKDAEGYVTAPTGSTAVEFCLVGAMYRAAHDLGENVHKLWDPLHKAAGSSLAVYNDRLFTKQQDVLHVFDQAIKLVEESDDDDH